MFQAIAIKQDEDKKSTSQQALAAYKILRKTFANKFGGHLARLKQQTSMGCMSHQVVGHPLQSISKNVPVHKSKGERPKTRKRTAMGCVGKTKATASIRVEMMIHALEFLNLSLRYF